MERDQLIALLKRAVPVIAVALGLVIAGVLIQKGLNWIRVNRENRQWLAVNELSPERLIKRCGPASNDETQTIFPVVERKMRYASQDAANVMLTFTRTAEENSTWVFVSMTEERSGVAYDTPAAKIAALPCLDSRK